MQMSNVENLHVRIDLVQALSILDDDDPYVEDELNCLQDVYQMTDDPSIGSECNIAKGLQRVVIGIKLEEHLPDLPARVACQSSKDGVKNDTWTISHLR